MDEQSNPIELFVTLSNSWKNHPPGCTEFVENLTNSRMFKIGWWIRKRQHLRQKWTYLIVYSCSNCTNQTSLKKKCYLSKLKIKIWQHYSITVHCMLPFWRPLWNINFRRNVPVPSVRRRTSAFHIFTTVTKGLVQRLKENCDETLAFIRLNWSHY